MIQPENVSIDDLILIGLISKPHGILGEVKVKVLTDFPSRFRKLKRVFLVPNNGEIKKIAVEKARILKGTVLIKFHEINSILEAKAIVGSEIAVLKEESVKPPLDTYYIFDLIGLQVVLSHGELIGTIQDVESHSAQDLLIVKSIHGNEVMIPFVKELVPEVSIKKKQIIVNKIPGLFDEA